MNCFTCLLLALVTLGPTGDQLKEDATALLIDDFTRTDERSWHPSSRREMGLPGPATRSICASKPGDVFDRAPGAERSDWHRRIRESG
jgi:hypothetical protein